VTHVPHASAPANAPANGSGNAIGDSSFDKHDHRRRRLRAAPTIRRATSDQRVGRSTLPVRTISRIILGSGDLTAILVGLAASGDWSPIAWAYTCAVVICLLATDAYRIRVSFHALNELPNLVRRLSLPVLLIFPFTIVSHDSRALGIQVVVTTVGVCLLRPLSYALLGQARRRGYLTERTIIAGTGKIGMELAALLQRYPGYGLRPVGFVDANTDDRTLPLALLGRIDDLPVILATERIHRVIVAFGPEQEAESVSILRAAVRDGVQIDVVPRYFDLGMRPGGTDADDIRGIPLHQVRRFPYRTVAWRAKRVLDVVGSTLILLLGVPLILVSAAVIRSTSPGRVLFRQRRTGRDGRPFELLKLRTMQNGHNGGESWGAPPAEQTGVGRLLRRTSIDELPQLWNVFRGDMSLVGPRPERPRFVEQFSREIPGYGDRHRLSVGLTGWAQVHGLRGEHSSLVERARFDNYYIDNWSLWLDAVVIARTIGIVVRDAVVGPSGRKARPVKSSLAHEPLTRQEVVGQQRS
jgi:exopolysaccharide biosynthesis polyprenyl glycosylphosphotransferase